MYKRQAIYRLEKGSNNFEMGNMMSYIKALQHILVIENGQHSSRTNDAQELGSKMCIRDRYNRFIEEIIINIQQISYDLKAPLILKEEGCGIGTVQNSISYSMPNLLQYLATLR